MNIDNYQWSRQEPEGRFTDRCQVLAETSSFYFIQLTFGKQLKWVPKTQVREVGLHLIHRAKEN
jgi:hypothetical protein